MPRIVTVVAEMQAKPGKEDALRAALAPVVEATRKEEGCIQYDLHVKTGDPASFFFYENWASAEHLQRHSVSPHLTAFREAAKDLLAGPSRVDTYERIA